MQNRLSPTSRSGVSGLSRGALLAGAAVSLVAANLKPALAEDSTVPPNASLDTLLDAASWLNGKPTRDSVRSKVVLVDVFTFDCYNCKNITPNLRTLSHERSAGLELLGIHSPETPFEREHDEVVSHLRTLGVTWPVAVDNSFALWKAYDIEYWPTQMIFDRRGKLRKVVIGDSQDAIVNGAVKALLREPA